MKKKLVNRRQVLAALTLLVGQTRKGFPSKITAAELKQMHRTRVFENHPDRASVLERSAQELQDKLASINVAYDFLISLMTNEVLCVGKFTRGPIRVLGDGLKSDTPLRRSPTSRVGSRTVGQNHEFRYRCREARYAGVMEDFWGAGIPQRRLRFGRFLYYSGAIRWAELVRAVEWQTKQRPIFGTIASELGFLTRRQVERLVAHGNEGELIGDYAVRRGLLSNFQRLVILGRQLNLQRPIGEYFVSSGKLSKSALDSHLRLHYHHNGTQPHGGFPRVA